MESRPLISVIVPTYNRADLLRITLNSIFSQSHEPHEVIVVDDGSTDHTSSMLNSETHSQLKVIYQPNNGQVAARYNGIQQCSGDWIALCDSDDVWSSDYIATFTADLEMFKNINYWFSNFGLIDVNGVSVGTDKLSEAPENWMQGIIGASNTAEDSLKLDDKTFFLSLLQFQPVFPSALIFKRSLYDDIGGFRTDLDLAHSEDAHLTRRIAAHGVGAMHSKPLVNIRKHLGNFSGEFQKNQEGRLEILEQLLRDGDLPESFASATQHAITRGNIELFKYLILTDQLETARAFGASQPHTIETLILRTKLAAKSLLQRINLLG
ncbi:glycosyltransferase family 2 protein [Congregibacter brevis]|uniref:Glycosyltransferase family 2 protein n=1 Tax=Congregibacter brevis TaxID=3081201 RepID=A0ABZ0IGZ4_9GAMM|nr:glycosyltransferase family 2 protein [Congregibacter sp. IMCC45268]